ncbi:MAG: hypothetical protein HOE50_00420, partial [Chloroflexi bacterium]|nr:hypothetical protein [Chloroflexota bacterium]
SIVSPSTTPVTSTSWQSGQKIEVAGGPNSIPGSWVGVPWAVIVSAMAVSTWEPIASLLLSVQAKSNGINVINKSLGGNGMGES